jgi:hypothetical protein
MKKHLLTLFISFLVLTASAQEISLSDSVIYFDKVPAAYYVKEINQTSPHYNVYIISLNKKLLIAAEVAQFEAPVRELKPFFYYNLVFQNEKDTLAIYHEGEAFTLELAKLLRDYHLLKGNTINKDSLVTFKQKYNGNALLLAKIKEFETYLNDDRFFNEQVVRDRTKPVTIVNDKIIMQDGKKIGVIAINTAEEIGNTFINVPTSDGRSGIRINNEEVGALNYKNIQVFLPTQRMVDASKVLIDPSDKRNRHDNSHPLYEKSYRLNKSDRNEAILWVVCQLVENYLL